MKSRTSTTRRVSTALIGFGAVSIAVTGTGLAAGTFGTVDAQGVIHACVDTTNGQTRIVNSAEDCRKNEQAVFWNQQGIQGKTGAQGIQGLKGDVGDTGATGPKGDVGDTGATGPKGDVGDTGATGPKGDVGDTGPQGPAGKDGATGATGSQGPAGADGHDGTTLTRSSSSIYAAGGVVYCNGADGDVVPTHDGGTPFAGSGEVTETAPGAYTATGLNPADSYSFYACGIAATGYLSPHADGTLDFTLRSFSNGADANGLPLRVIVSSGGSYSVSRTLTLTAP